jgi:hypothetical protein
MALHGLQQNWTDTAKDYSPILPLQKQEMFLNSIAAPRWSGLRWAMVQRRLVQSNYQKKEKMKTVFRKGMLFAIAAGLAAASLILLAHGQVMNHRDAVEIEKAIRARLAEIQAAAEGLDSEKVFGFVLENNKGALIQNGRMLLTRQEALDATRRGLSGLGKVEYHFNAQHISLLSPTIALAVGEGESSATTVDGRSLHTPFAQSVVLVLTNGEWKVFHAHRSFPPR